MMQYELVVVVVLVLVLVVDDSDEDEDGETNVVLSTADDIDQNDGDDD